MNKTKEKKLLTRILDIKRELEERKALYAEYDKLVTELVEGGFDSGPVGEFVAVLKDNFAKGVNTAWTAAPVKRFDVEFLTDKQIAKRAVK